MATTIPALLVAGPLAGYLVGTWVDRRFGSDPWGLILGVAWGLVASGKATIDLIKRLTSSDP